MSAREVVIGLGVASLGLGALTLAFAIRALVRRRAGRGWFWGGLVARVIVIAALLWSGVATLRNLPAPPFANRVAPGAGDAIIVIHTQNAYRAEDISTNQLQGVSAGDGAVRWTRTFSQVVGAVVAGPPGIVLATTGGGSGASALYAVRTSDGALLWSHANAGQYMESYFPHPGLASDSARVFALTQRPNGQSLEAFSAVSGATLWSVPSPESQSPLSLATDGGALYVVTGAEGNTWRITALRATDGARLWSVSPPPSSDPQVDDRQPIISVAGGRAFVAPRQDRVTALDARTGATLWSASASPVTGDPLGPLATLASGDTLYVAGQLLNAAQAASGHLGVPATESLYRLVALDARTGAPHWSAPLDVVPMTLESSGDALVAIGADGAVETFAAATGAPRWDSARTLTNDAPWKLTREQYAPFTVGGTVYLVNNELDPNGGFCIFACPGVAWLYAADAHSGTLWWRARMGPTSLTHITL